MHTWYDRFDLGTPPPTSQAWSFLGQVAEILKTHPAGPRPEFPGYSSAQAGAVARAVAESGAEPWHLGGFRFADGSVVRCAGEVGRLENWSILSTPEAAEMVRRLVEEPLAVCLLYAFVGGDGRARRSAAEARFEPSGNGWRLVVEYEAFMDSPLYGLEAGRATELLEAGAWSLCVRAAVPSQTWRLEQILMNPDWVELLV